LKDEVGDSLAVIAYHLSDAFANSDASGRQSYYGVQYIPTTWYDDGVYEGYRNYSEARSWFNQRKNIAPEAEITLFGDYNQANGQGWVTVRIKNISSSLLTGYCRFAICQRDTPYAWQGEDSFYFIERKMLPSYSGTYVSIPVGNSTEVTQSFTVQSSWERDDCYIVAFVQKSDMEIAQSAESDLEELTPGIEEMDSQGEPFFTISPSPTHNYLNLKFREKNILVQLIDCTGAVRKQILAKEQKLTIPLNEFSPGIYFCRVIKGDEEQIQKFIKL